MVDEEDDDRPLLSDLLEKHASNLIELRANLEKEPSFSKEHYDDIWMLRFLLSHKAKVSKASAAATRAMIFRKERKMNELGDIRSKMLDPSDTQSDRYFEIHRKYFSSFKGHDAIVFALPDPNRGLIQYIKPEKVDMHKIVEEMTYEEVLESYMLNNEITYQILNEITRRTGRLTKILRIVDLTNFTLHNFNVEYAKRDAAGTKELEDFYPQSLGRLVYVNPPTWADAIWRLFRPLFPKRFVEKVAMVSPIKKPKDIKYFLKYVTKDNLSVSFGGNNKEWPPPVPSQYWN